MKKFSLLLLAIAISLVFTVSCVSPASKHVRQGDVYFEQGQWDQATVEYEAALELDSELQINDKLADAYARRAEVHFDNKEYDKAIATCEKAFILLPTVEISPKLADAYVQRAETHFSSGDYDKAIADYNKAIKLAPKEASSFTGGETPILIKEIWTKR